MPSQLRKFVSHKENFLFSASNIADILNQLIADHPAIKPYLLDDNDEIYHFVNIYVNGQDIRFLGGVNAELEEADVITLIPAMAGG